MRVWPPVSALTIPILVAFFAISSGLLIDVYAQSSTFGEDGAGNGQFRNPVGVAANSTHVLVSDTVKHTVQIFDLDGNYVSQLGSGTRSTADGEFDAPRGVAINSTHILVVDTGNRVQIFDLLGNYVSQFGDSIDDDTLSDGELLTPQGIAINSTHILVADRGNNIVQIFDHSGNYVSDFGSRAGHLGAGLTGDGNLSAPRYIALTDTNILVTDRGNERVQIFDHSGNYVSQFGSGGDGNGEFDDPTGIALTSTHILVTDERNHRIQTFTLAGTYVSQFGSSGSGNDQFNRPAGITISGDNVFVADTRNDRVHKIALSTATGITPVPTVTITSTVDADSVTNSRSITYTASFSEDVTGFDAISDITLSGTATATVAAPTGSGASYTFVVTATTDGIVTVSIPADAAVDSDSTGNAVSAEYTITIDTVAPTFTSAATTSETTIDVITSEPLIGTATVGDFGVSGTSLARVDISDSTITITTITPITFLDTPTVSYTGSSITDAAGNALAQFTGHTVTNNVHAVPTVSSVSSSGGPYGTGDTVPIIVTFSESVTVTGTPILSLDIGATTTIVDYTSGSPGEALTFTYTVAAGDNSADLNYLGRFSLELNGGSIVATTGGGTAILTLPATTSAQSLGGSDIIIDSTAPTLISAATASSNTVAITLSEPIFTATGAELRFDSSVNDADISVTSFSRDDVILTLVLDTTIMSGDAVTISYTGTSLRDAAGNELAEFTDQSVTNNVSAGPSVSSVTSTGGPYNTDDTVPITVTFSESVTVTGTPQLTLETGTTDAVVDYDTGSPGAALTFTYTVAAGHNSNDLNYVGTDSLSLNSGTIVATTGGVAAVLTLPATTSAQSLGGSDVVIDTIAPTFSSAATTSTTMIVITASESLTGTPAAADFTLTGNTISTVTASGSTITITVGTAITNADTITVALGGTSVTDLAGNALTFTAQIVTNNVSGPFQVFTFGSFGTGNAQFDSPRAIAVNSTHILVADQNNNRIQTFDLDGNYVGQFGGSGTGNGEFSSPTGIAVNSTHILVTDQSNHRIQTFDLDGNYVGQFGSSGSGNGLFSFPRGIIVNSTHILVADVGNARIQTFDLDGNYIGQFGSRGSGDGQFRNPNGITTNSTHILVSDILDHRVQIFDHSGNYVSQFGSSGTGDGQFNAPSELEVTATHILVTDSTNNRVQIFDHSGNYQSQLGNFGSPYDVYVNAGIVFVTDTVTNHVNVFGLSTFFDETAPTFSSAGTTSETTIDVTASEPLFGTPNLADFTVSGNTVSSVAISGSTITLTVGTAITSTDTVTVALTGTSVTDLAGNALTFTAQSVTNNVSADPSVSSVTATGGPYNTGDPVTIIVTFSESVTVTGTPQLTLETGTTDAIVNYASGSPGTALTFTYTVAAGHNSNDLNYVGTDSLSLNSGTIVATTGGAAAVLTLPAITSAQSLGGSDVIIDTVAPTVTISSTTADDDGLTNSNVILYTVTFSEPVTGFTPFDLILTGVSSTLANFVGSGTTYTFDVTNTGGTDGDVVVSVLADGVIDAAGNGNTASAVYTVTIDTVAPTFTSAATTSETTIDVIASEALAGTPAIGDFTIPGNTVSTATISGSTITITVGTAITDTDTITVELSGTSVTDLAGNALAFATQSVTNNVPTPLTVTEVTTAAPAQSYRQGEGVPITVTFSEPITVTGTPQLTLDIGGTLVPVGLDRTEGDSQLIFRYVVAAGHNTDDFNYAGTDSLSLNGGTIVATTGGAAADLMLPTPASSGLAGIAIVVDTTAPTVAISSNTADNDGTTGSATVSYTATFSEATTDFILSDITVSGTAQGGSPVASNFAGSGTTYTFDVVTTTDGTVVVSIPASSATDAAGNQNAVSNTYTVTIDTSSLTVSLSSGTANSGDTTSTQTISYTATFSSAVTDFVMGDITVTGTANGGTLAASSFMGSGTDYTFDVVTTSDGTVTVSIPAGVATNAGTTNTASNTYTVTIDTTAPIFSTAATTSPTTIDITASESLSGTATAGDFTVSGNTVSAASISGSTITITVGTAITDTDTLTVSYTGTTITDAAGNALVAFTGETVTNNVSAAPTVTSVTATGGPYNTGGTVPIIVTFSESVTITGTPQLTLETGTTDAVVDYTSGSPGTALTFTYTVAAGHNSNDLNYVGTDSLSLNSGTIVATTGGVAADLTLPATTSAQSLGGSDVVIDTIAPTFSSAETTSETTIVITASESLTGTPVGGDFTLTGNTFSSATISGSTIIITVGTAITNTDAITVALGGTFVTDLAGNALTFTAQTVTNNVAAGPSVSSVTATGGPYNTGDTVPIIVTFSESVTITGTPQLTLETGTTDAVVDYTSGSPGAALTFTYTVAAGHNSNDLNYVGTDSLSLNSGTIVATTGGVAAVLTLPATTSAQSLGGSDVIIDTVAPTFSSAGTTSETTIDVIASESLAGTPAIGDFTVSSNTVSAASISGSTITITVNTAITSTDTVTVALTGTSVTDLAGNALTFTAQTVTNNVSALPTVTEVTTLAPAQGYSQGEGIPVIVRFSESVTVTGTPQLTLNIGGTMVPVNIDRGSGTTDLVFRYVVAAGHNTDNFNYAGTDSLSLNSGTIVATTGGAAADLTLPTPSSSGLAGIAIVVDTTAPTVAISSNTANDGGIASSATVSYTVTFSETTTDFVIGDITVSGTAESGSPVASNFAGSGTDYTFDVVTTSDGTVVVSIPASSATDAAGNQNTVSNTYTVTINTATLTVSLSSGTANSGDTTSTQTISYTATFSSAVTDFVEGDITVTGTANGGTLTASNFAGSGTDYTFDVVTTSDGTVVVSIPAGSVTDSSGNQNTVSNTYTITIDTLTPAIVRSIVTGSNTIEVTTNVDLVESSVNATTVTMTINGIAATITDRSLVAGNNIVITVSNTLSSSNAIVVTLMGVETLAGDTLDGVDTLSDDEKGLVGTDNMVSITDSDNVFVIQDTIPPNSILDDETSSTNAILDLSNILADADNPDADAIIPVSFNITRSGITIHLQDTTGVLGLPDSNQILLSTLARPADLPQSTNVDFAVEIGSPDHDITLSNPARISFSGLAGSTPYYVNAAGATMVINTTCDDDSAGSLGITTPGECQIVSGSGDLVVWTYHFTTFGAFSTPTASEDRNSDYDIEPLKPHFGKSPLTQQQLVTCGFSMDGECRDVMDYHVQYERTVIQTGTSHDFTLKPFNNFNLKMVQLGFGVAQVGDSINTAEALIEVELVRDYESDVRYTIQSVKTTNNLESVIDEVTESNVRLSSESCRPGAAEECLVVHIDDVLFRETFYSEPFAINVVDEIRLSSTNYMNEGLELIGESLNPAPEYEIITGKKVQQELEVLQLVRTDKINNIWTDNNGNTWTRNDVGSWLQLTYTPYVEPQDPAMSVMTRINNNFDALIEHEKERAVDVFNSSKISG